MQVRTLQKIFAYTALFLLPFPALNFGVSFTFADLFLLLAIALNFSALLRLHAFQVPFLLAVPFFVVSQLMDADGDLIAVAQILYIWGVVLPFGWCAFAELPLRRLAQVLLLSAFTNSVVAVGQYLLIIPMLSNHKTILVGGEVARAAGLSNACNSLVMSLTPCFLLLPALRRPSWRVLAMFTLTAGLLASVSKSVLLAVPGLLYFVWRDPQKRRLMPALAVATLTGVFAVERTIGLQEMWTQLSESAMVRAENTWSSVDTRFDLVSVALDYAAECLVFGYGTEGTFQRISQEAESTVHVYYLGLVVIAGLPAAALLASGMLLQVVGLWRARERSLAAFVAAHLLACMVMTVLLLSFQNLPFMVAGAVLARRAGAPAVDSASQAVPLASSGSWLTAT